MIYKRKENFRLRLNPPLPVVFRIVGVESRETTSSAGQALLMDISPGGLRIETEYNLPVLETLKLEFELTLTSNPLVVTGQIIWRKKAADGYQYGIQLIVSPKLRQSIVNNLKDFVKEHGQLRKG